MTIRPRLTVALVFLTLGLLSLLGYFFGPGIISRWRGTGATDRCEVSALTIFTLCGHRLRAEEADPEVLASLQGRKSGARYGDWFVLESSPGKLILACEAQGLCPNCRQSNYLGISGGLVAVYNGTPDTPGPLMEVTGIQASALPPAERADLERGIPFKSEGERLQLLEGLIAVIDG